MVYKVVNIVPLVHRLIYKGNIWHWKYFTFNLPLSIVAKLNFFIYFNFLINFNILLTQYLPNLIYFIMSLLIYYYFVGFTHGFKFETNWDKYIVGLIFLILYHHQ